MRWIVLVVCLGGCRLNFDERALDSGVDDATGPAEASTVTCPPSYTVAATGCYRWSTAGVSTTAAAAQTACAADGPGAHLAVISSLEENQILTALEGTSTSWIGLGKPGASFVWVTGDAPVYTNWAPGDPNGEGDCTRLLQSSGNWDDELCMQVHTYLCEIDGRSATVVLPAL